MKNFKLISALSLGLLFSTNSLVVASCNYSECYNNYCEACCKSCDGCDFSQDFNYYVYKLEGNDSVFIRDVEKSKDIFEFRNLISFSFSQDSKYILVERSEYSTKFNAQNDFLEIFDLVNKKRIFYMPFIKKSYPSTSLYTKKSCSVGIFKLNFYEDSLASVSLDNIIVPTNLYGVESAYMSQVGTELSVKFKDGSIGIYIPKKDFSGIDEVLSFGKTISKKNMVSFYAGCY